MTPVFKSGNTTLPENYRPVSVISVFAQILERIIERQLYIFAELNILPRCQYGFRKRHNTTHAAMALVSNILEQKDLGKLCGVAFIDLRNAFPSADHEVLLQKLSLYGIRGNLLKWIGSYLTGRVMTIYIDNRSSVPVQPSRGVPQGSPLGPLMFSIYYADVVYACNAHSSLFADDTEIHVAGDTPEEIVTQLNDSMASLSYYFRVNRLELNTKKTVWMLVHHDSEISATVRYNDKVIERVTDFKYLGFTIDQRISWKLHISNVVTRVRRRLYYLWRGKYSVSREGKLLLFNALIMPYLNYGIELWFASNKTLRGTLELIYRYCLRIILNDVGSIPTISNFDLYVTLDVLPLSLLFQIKVGRMIHKALVLDSAPAVKRLLVDSQDRQTASISRLSQRVATPLRVPFYRLESSRACFVFYAAHLWNRLPLAYREANSEREFVSAYQNYLLSRMHEEGIVDSSAKFYDFV